MFLIYLKVAEEFNYELIIVCYILRMKYILLNSIFILSVISSIDDNYRYYSYKDNISTSDNYKKVPLDVQKSRYADIYVYNFSNSLINTGTIKIDKKFPGIEVKEDTKYKDDCCSVM